MSNINIDHNKFCLGPVAGSFFTIDTSSIYTRFIFKNQSGGVLDTYIASTNIVDDVLSLCYIGPTNLGNVPNMSVFVTLEKVSNSVCSVKIWEADTNIKQMNLKKNIIKYRSGSYNYNALSLCTENRKILFDDNNEGGKNYIDVNSSDFVSVGSKLFLGPSTAPNTPNATEFVYVSFIDGNRLYLSSDIVNQYLEGDSITFCDSMYLFSYSGKDEVPNKGALYRLSFYNGSVLDYNLNGVYRAVVFSRWCSYFNLLVFGVGDNMIFLDPYDFYIKNRSMNLSNFLYEYDERAYVYDVEFDGYDVFKLMDKGITYSDDGEQIIEDWANSNKYNFNKDSLLPYTHNLLMFVDKNKLIGPMDTTNIEIVARDQYNVGLLDVTVRFFINMSGDQGAVIDPDTNLIITDSNGKGSISYTNGSVYSGVTELSCKADKRSTYTGTEFVWSYTGIYSDVSVSEKPMFIFQDKELYSSSFFKSMPNSLYVDNISIAKSYFCNPLGDVNNRFPSAGDLDSTFLSQVDDFISTYYLNHHSDFNIYNNIRQLYYSWSMSFSQLKQSRHVYWYDGHFEDDLITNTKLNQFVFVEDAVPKFFSEKNNINTDIWLRLRPFSHSLNKDTLSVKIREKSFKFDTGFIDVTSSIYSFYFDAGSGLQGIELLYDPAGDFFYDSVVYVNVSVYDYNSVPNYINLDYYFIITPDFKIPYIDNLYPPIEATDVSINTGLSFYINDVGAGVDINSLYVSINSMSIIPDDIIKVDDNRYGVFFNNLSLLYSREYSIHIGVNDLSKYKNRLNFGYSFKTADSGSPIIERIYPNACNMGIDKYSDIKYLLLSGGYGLDKGSINFNVGGFNVKNRTKFNDILYRIE